MALVEDYRDQLLRLLPPGRAWAVQVGSRIYQLFHGWADELARLHERALDLREEADPRSTEELLPEWEYDAGLPDACSGAGGTLAARLAELERVLTDEGLQRVQDYIDAAASLGFTITVDEFTPLQCGDDCGDPLRGWEWWYTLQINAPTVTVHAATAGGSTAGDPLRWWGNDVLECVLERMKQAHVTLVFSYS